MGASTVVVGAGTVVGATVVGVVCPDAISAEMIGVARDSLQLTFAE